MDSGRADDFTGEPCYVYVLGSSGPSGRLTYVGWSTDIERRLADHNSGKGARSTRGRVWRIIYAERCESRSAAMSREAYLKRERGFRKSLAQHLI